MRYLESVIGFVIIFGCGFGLSLFGLWTGSRTGKPVGFWANGKPLDPKTVTDIPAYNRTLGKLFRYYGIPCMLSGVIIAFSPVNTMFAYISLVILVVWGVFGTWWLIRSYKQIESKYILR